MSQPRPASAAEQTEYGVGKTAWVLAKINSSHRRDVGGVDFYSARFPWHPYEMIIKCTGEGLSVQESVGFRERLRLKQEATGAVRRCGAREPQGVHVKAKSVTVDVIDTQYVESGWGVLIICEKERKCR